MSYDIRFGVEVKDANGLIAEIGCPEYDQPTYNLADMFRKCTGWNYVQGEWYKVPDVLPLIEHGIMSCNLAPRNTRNIMRQTDGEPSNLPWSAYSPSWKN